MLILARFTISHTLGNSLHNLTKFPPTVSEGHLPLVPGLVFAKPFDLYMPQFPHLQNGA